MWDDVPADVLSTLSEGNLQVLIGTDQYASGEITGQIQRLFLNDYKTIRKGDDRCPPDADVSKYASSRIHES